MPFLFALNLWYNLSMLNLLALSTKLPEGVGEFAGQIADPSYIGNLLVIAIFLVVIGIYGFMMERHNMLINLLALYLGVLLVNFFPTNMVGMSWVNEWWGMLAVLLCSIILATIFLRWTHLFRVSYTYNFIVRWWQATVSACLYAGLLISVILSVLPTDFLRFFSDSFLQFFVSELAVFLWLVIPLVGLLFIRHKRKGGGRPAY